MLVSLQGWFTIGIAQEKKLVTLNKIFCVPLCTHAKDASFISNKRTKLWKHQHNDHSE